MSFSVGSLRSWMGGSIFLVYQMVETGISQVVNDTMASGYNGTESSSINGVGDLSSSEIKLLDQSSFKTLFPLGLAGVTILYLSAIYCYCKCKKVSSQVVPLDPYDQFLSELADSVGTSVVNVEAMRIETDGEDSDDERQSPLNAEDSALSKRWQQELEREISQGSLPGSVEEEPHLPLSIPRARVNWED
jgi:hypothetical protein